MSSEVSVTRVVAWLIGRWSEDGMRTAVAKEAMS